ncbi:MULTISPECIES: thiolase family protein [Delftia]|uniref:Thiolase family protein n=2 Tax=Delftia TaxID=80865 RepID=A0A7T2S7H7_DELAC|nr:MULTISPECIES: thiolase family protein [Delftia]MBB1649280.1 DitF protein [Delftia sp. UME58]MBL8354212.1 thiolase family protein [Delftia acidovorans]QPS10351.1 thiolase family protein [Delftia acidovorans]
MNHALIQGAVEIPYARRTTESTTHWLGQAFEALVQQHGFEASRIDGLGVASFTLRPDRCIDLAWRLGLQLSWFMDDGNGGVSGLNLLQHAIAAIETGQARNIVLLAGDAFQASEFQDLSANYNRTTQTLLRPLGIANPNTLFALLTQRHMAREGLSRSDYGQLVLAQRRHASRNPQAVYRSAMSMDDYLNAAPVADPLVIYDCVPVVAGANAILISHADEVARRAGCVRVRSLQACHNHDGQQGDGLSTGLSRVAGQLFSQAGCNVGDIDLWSVYDDYPVMSLVQLQDLGLIEAGGLQRFLREAVPQDRIAVNTSGGQLSAGQAGTAGGMHGLVEAVRQLGGRCGERQLARARTALVSGYGMVEYRYGMCANATILEGLE